MDADRWQRLNDLFHAALERDPATRDAFLEAACADDAALRGEAQSLLRAYADPSVLDRPAAAMDPGDALIGRRLGPYRIESLIGRGGMGVVYRGLDTRLRRPVAVKALPPAFTHDRQLRERLRREAMAAAALSHPGIATVFALEEFDGQLYLVCEYVPGLALAAMTAARGGTIPIDEVLPIAVNVARALGAAHAGGVVHRDLKPDNVILTPDGGVKVVDFGLARFEPGGGGPDAGAPLTRPGGAPGTPGYVAPEILRGGPADARADQFSFGVLLYELVAGRHPFRGADDGSTAARVLEADPPAIEPVRPDCPAALARVIMTCLAKDPRDRYPGAEALSADLDEIASPGTPAAEPLSAPPGGRPPRRGETSSPLWWWRFHQVAVSALYGAALCPLWLMRQSVPGGWGLAAFVAGAAIVGAAANVRLHLWFTSRVYPAELAEQRRRTSAWRRLSDAAFAILLLSVAAVLVPSQGLWAALFIAMAISVAVIAYVMEPATTRAAFPHG